VGFAVKKPPHSCSKRDLSRYIISKEEYWSICGKLKPKKAFGKENVSSLMIELL
jgi:hypothetical protein